MASVVHRTPESVFPRLTSIEASVLSNVVTSWISCPETIHIHPWDRVVMNLEIGEEVLKMYKSGGRVGACMPRGSELCASPVPSKYTDVSISVEIWNPTDTRHSVEMGTYIAFIAPF